MTTSLGATRFTRGSKYFRSVRSTVELEISLKLKSRKGFTVSELLRDFRLGYKAYHGETRFKRKVVMLLDLYKLEIIWGGLKYR